jgi:hypothetical protein
MEFILTKIYAKLYISQILNSISYSQFKANQMEIENLFNDENQTDSNKIPILEDNSKLKKLLVYKNIIYSNVEIMGLVVEKQIMGDDSKLRHILFIDDGTGIIQAIIWKNFNTTIFDKVDKNIVISLNFSNVEHSSALKVI